MVRRFQTPENLASSPLGRRSLPLLAALALATGAASLSACRPRGRSVELESGKVASAFTPPVSVLAAAAAATLPRSFAPSRAGCESVAVFDRGAAAGSSCVDDLAEQGLTVIDLSDEWTPRVFAPDPTTRDAPAYRAKYLELASQPNSDLGLYGIAPTLTVLAERLTDERRMACHAANDRAPLTALSDGLAATADERARAALVKGAASRLAVQAAQGELVCAGLLLKSRVSGTMTAPAQLALDAFRRRHMIVATGGLEASTVAALALGGDELAFRGLLRGLRERVADAAGLVEDGSATGETALVADRALDFSRFARPVSEPEDGAAPDLVDAATDAAARALGWTSPEATRAFLTAHGKDGLRALRVAVALPAAPSYHARSMELRVEIDRGDVFYDTPGRAAAERRKLGATRGPSFVVFAKDGDRERPLVHWSTTIGGWQKERSDDGEVALKYKESDVGERVWRRLVAAPAWMPPDSTPESDLLREADDGSLALKRDLIQPGYRNAYGLVMLIHDEPILRRGETTWADHGIRTHGSVNYRSIERGESHGCHRLYNQLALRLAGFLLQHRTTVRKGKMGGGYHRTLEYKGQTVEVDVPTRGYLYELDPPVPVRVLPGRVVGEAQRAVSSAIPIKTDGPKG